MERGGVMQCGPFKSDNCGLFGNSLFEGTEKVYFLSNVVSYVVVH